MASSRPSGSVLTASFRSRSTAGELGRGPAAPGYSASATKASLCSSAVAYHAFLEQEDPRLEGFPNADRFLKLANALPKDDRHLELHAGHLTELNDIDKQVVTGDAMAITPFPYHADEVVVGRRFAGSKGAAVAIPTLRGSAGRAPGWPWGCRRQ